MTDKNFEKINIKFEIRIYQYMDIWRNMENFSCWDQICPKNIFGWSIRTNAT